MLKSKVFVTLIVVATALIAGEVWLYAQPTTSPPQTPVAIQPAPKTPKTIPRLIATMPHTGAISPALGTPTTTPAFIVVNTPTTVTIKATVTGSGIIPNSVNLLRLGATGTQPIILGVMQNSGGGVFTLQVPFNEPSAGQLSLQVSAAFQGRLTRVLSPSVVLTVWNTFTQTVSTTPVSLIYPPAWNASSGSSSAEIYLSPSNKVPDPSLEYTADIAINIIPNPSHQDLASYYGALGDGNLYEAAAAISQFTTSNGFQAVYFTDISGTMIPTDVIAVAAGNMIVELYDVGEQHNMDEILQTVANSIQ